MAGRGLEGESVGLSEASQYEIKRMDVVRTGRTIEGRDGMAKKTTCLATNVDSFVIPVCSHGVPFWLYCFAHHSRGIKYTHTRREESNQIPSPSQDLRSVAFSSVLECTFM